MAAIATHVVTVATHVATIAAVATVATVAAVVIVRVVAVMLVHLTWLSATLSRFGLVLGSAVKGNHTAADAGTFEGEGD